MEKAMKALDYAFRTISHISVREGDVELMVAAKQALKDAWAMLDQKQKTQQKEAANGQTD